MKKEISKKAENKVKNLNSNVKMINKKEFAYQNFSLIKIPFYISKISESAFENCFNLETVIFKRKSHLNVIGDYAFLNCKSLENISLPKSLKRIGFNAFGNSKLLKNIVIYKGAKYVGDNRNPFLMLYESCYELNHISVHPKTRFILNSAFLDDEKLISITLNKALIDLGEACFDGCTNLKSIRIKKNHSIKSIQQYAFDNCVSLKYVFISEKRFDMNNKKIKGFILKNK